jgi:DNA-binding IclR family transcriptional regulator
LTDATRETPRYLIQSAATTLEVLLIFSQPPGRFSPSEIAALMDIDRNQAFRCLRTLQHVGFIRLDEDDRFVLTPLTVQLAASAQPQTSLIAAAKPFLDELSQRTGETVNLFLREGDAVVVVDHREGLKPVRLVTELGRRASLHAGACPKAVLAFLPSAEQDAVLAQLATYPTYTPFTAVSAAVLAQELSVIRRRGYAISDLDVDPDARGVGAPIFEQAGRVTGAVSVGGPSSRMTPSRLTELGEAIVDTAQLISRQLGFIGQAPARGG